MIKIKHAFRVPKIDVATFERRVNAVFSKAISEATFQYLVTISGVIPVWSGASIGTFASLASEIGFHLDVAPAGSAPESRFGLGKAAGTGEVIVGSGGQYSFSYSTDLRHLVFNEYNDANAVGFHLIRPGPYDFQGKGTDAVKKVFDAVLPPTIPIRMRVIK